MKHSWSSGNEGAPACLRCRKVQTPENIEADNCGEREPFRSYMDDLDGLMQRIKELRVEDEVRLRGADEEK